MLIHQLLLVLHIVAGSVALLLFCAVMAVAKGSPLHRRVGTWFYVVMHALTLSGIGMAVLVLLDPLAMKGAAQPVGVSSADYLRQVQLFWQFLLLLSLLADGFVAIQKSITPLSRTASAMCFHHRNRV